MGELGQGCSSPLDRKKRELREGPGPAQVPLYSRMEKLLANRELPLNTATFGFSNLPK